MDECFERLPICGAQYSIPSQWWISPSPTAILTNRLLSTRDASVGEFCPAVERSQAIPRAQYYRFETTLGDTDKGTLNCTALSVEEELSWDVVEELRRLLPIDNDQIAESRGYVCERPWSSTLKRYPGDHMTLATVRMHNFK